MSPIAFENLFFRVSRIPQQVSDIEVAARTTFSSQLPKPWQLLARLQLTLQISRERRQLAALDDRLLKDIGLSRSLAHREVERSILDLPIGRDKGAEQPIWRR